MAMGAGYCCKEKRMSIRRYDDNGNLVALWDDSTRLYTEYNKAGAEVVNRPFTAEENAIADALAVQDTQNANKQALLQKAAAALTANASFLALASPTTAQAVTQVKALTRQVNALIKLAVNDLANQDGT